MKEKKTKYVGTVLLILVICMGLLGCNEITQKADTPSATIPIPTHTVSFESTLQSTQEPGDDFSDILQEDSTPTQSVPTHTPISTATATPTGTPTSTDVQNPVPTATKGLTTTTDSDNQNWGPLS